MERQRSATGWIRVRSRCTMKGGTTLVVHLGPGRHVCREVISQTQAWRSPEGLHGSVLSRSARCQLRLQMTMFELENRGKLADQNGPHWCTREIHVGEGEALFAATRRWV